jgi:hypothetical protein
MRQAQSSAKRAVISGSGAGCSITFIGFLPAVVPKRV